MPSNNIQYVLCYGILPIVVFTIACAGYAHHVDARRADDDPEKKNYPLLAIAFAPITIPLFAIISIITFLLTAVIFGIAPILFVAALILVREPIIFRWLGKKVLPFGNKLLELNTALIRLWSPKTAQKSPYNFDSLARRLLEVKVIRDQH